MTSSRWYYECADSFNLTVVVYFKLQLMDRPPSWLREKVKSIIIINDKGV